ncbi:MAG: hypothetical protein CMM05_09295 [Rhodopirellula sp.]|nr:hypothetical protein [Rhodopirellula sp.]
MTIVNCELIGQSSHFSIYTLQFNFFNDPISTRSLRSGFDSLKLPSLPFRIDFRQTTVTVVTFSELCEKVDSRLKASVTSQNQQWASRQLADYDARLPGTMFAEGVVLDVAQGYELQSAVAQWRCGRGERVIGYKVGCTSPTIRAQLGINHCVSGRLYDSEQHSSGAVLSRERFANLAIEGEIAVELSREPNEKEFSEVEIPACVARVFPVIELHNHVMRGERPSAGELIANNAIHAGVVAGSGVRLTDICGANDNYDSGALDSSALSIFADDRLLDECAGPTLIQTINSSLKWLTKSVRDRGERLSAGQIILTGSIPSLIPIAEDCGIRVDAPPFGSVEVKFITCPSS